jgi:hypothetical protein
MPDAIRLPDEGANPEVVDAYTLYVTPELALAVHVRLIWLDDAAVAARFDGADGGAAATVTLTADDAEVVYPAAPPYEAVTE